MQLIWWLVAIKHIYGLISYIITCEVKSKGYVIIGRCKLNSGKFIDT